MFKLTALRFRKKKNSENPLSDCRNVGLGRFRILGSNPTNPRRHVVGFAITEKKANLAQLHKTVRRVGKLAGK